MCPASEDGRDSRHPEEKSALAATHELDQRLLAAVEEQLDQQLAHYAEILAPIAPEAVALTDWLREFLMGGKRLRPRFCLMGALAVPQTNRESDCVLDEATVTAVARMGAAIELLQAAALIHDDVIDHSDTRRGRPAIHRAAAMRHTNSELSGDSDEFGTATAIVLGDLALAWSETMLSTGEDGVQLPPAVLEEFAKLRTEMMTGQYLDVLHQAGGFTSPADDEAAALAVVRWKTVPYTVERPLRMGATAMGASAELLDELSTWAHAIGTGFQLRDDLLSVVSSHTDPGKPMGGDIVEGKRTVLLARTYQAVADKDPSFLELLDATVGNPDAAEQDVEAVRAAMVQCGAVASVSEDIARCAEQARQLLADSRVIAPHAKVGLQSLADQATRLSDLKLDTQVR